MDAPETPETAHARARAIFLETFAQSGNIAASCRAARLGRASVYRYREADAAFAALWDDALAEATDALEAEARRRALEGVPEPVYQGGKRVGQVQRYSDTLLLALLKAHRPDKYRDKVVKNEHSGTVTLEHTLTAALAKAEEARRALGR